MAGLRHAAIGGGLAQGNFSLVRSKTSEQEEAWRGGEGATGASEGGMEGSRRSPFVARLANLEEGRCQ